MDATDFGHLDDFTGLGWLHSTWLGALHIEEQMRAKTDTPDDPLTVGIVKKSHATRSGT